jgi:hypothetical protein
MHMPSCADNDRMLVVTVLVVFQFSLRLRCRACIVDQALQLVVFGLGMRSLLLRVLEKRCHNDFVPCWSLS